MIPKLEQIKALLWKDWDPIGCGVLKDDYDAYTIPIWMMLEMAPLFVRLSTGG